MELARKGVIKEEIITAISMYFLCSMPIPPKFIDLHCRSQLTSILESFPRHDKKILSFQKVNHPLLSK